MGYSYTFLSFIYLQCIYYGYTSKHTHTYTRRTVKNLLALRSSRKSRLASQRCYVFNRDLERLKNFYTSCVTIEGNILNKIIVNWFYCILYNTNTHIYMHTHKRTRNCLNLWVCGPHERAAHLLNHLLSISLIGECLHGFLNLREFN